MLYPAVVGANRRKGSERYCFNNYCCRNLENKGQQQHKHNTMYTLIKNPEQQRPGEHQSIHLFVGNNIEMRKITKIVLLIIVMLSACKNENNYIIPTDFSVLFPDSTQISNGITEKEQQKITAQFIKTLRDNTINHRIPDLSICDIEGKSINLRNQLTGIKLIIASSMTCSWNMEGLLVDFPKTNQLINNPINKSEIIILIQNEDNEYFNQQYQKNIEEIKKYYSNIYLIDSLQSTKLNVFGLTRYYISEENIVLEIGRGTGLNTDHLRIELEKNTVANN